MTYKITPSMPEITLVQVSMLLLFILMRSSYGDVIDGNENVDTRDNTAQKEGHREPDLEDSENRFPAIVKLFIQDINYEEIAECTGVFITNTWVISSASCLEKATSDTILKVCSDSESLTSPEVCKNATNAHKVIFPQYFWYNDLAFIETDGFLNKSMPLEWKITDPAPMENCRIIGFTSYNDDGIHDILLSKRRMCLHGYYCLDDATGWACIFDKGSALICNDIVRGIYVGPHKLSCDDPTPDVEEEEPEEEERWAFLFFISFKAYQGTIKKVLNGNFYALDDN